MQCLTQLSGKQVNRQNLWPYFAHVCEKERACFSRHQFVQHPRDCDFGDAAGDGGQAAHQLPRARRVVVGQQLNIVHVVERQAVLVWGSVQAIRAAPRQCRSGCVQTCAHTHTIHYGLECSNRSMF